MIAPFMPRLIYFEPDALDYPLGVELHDKFKKLDAEIRYTTSHNQVRNLPGESDLQRYRASGCFFRKMPHIGQFFISLKSHNRNHLEIPEREDSRPILLQKQG